MARTLPAAIQTALASGGQQPTFSVTMQDLINRFAAFATNTNSTPGRSAGMLSSTGAIIRAYVSSGSVLYAQRIATPATASSWTGAWTQVSTTASPAAGCALAQTGSTTRLFYQNSSNGNIYYYDSTDDGLTWTAGAQNPPASPVAVNNLCYGIAAADNINTLYAIYADYANAASFLYRSYLSTSWSAWASVGPANTGWGQLRGIAASKPTTGGIATGGAGAPGGAGGTTAEYIAAGVQLTYPLTGIACAVTYYPSWPQWTTAWPLDNPNIGISIANPHIFYDGNIAYLTMIANDSGSLSGTAQTRGVIYTSTDGVTYYPWAEVGTGWNNDLHTIIVGGFTYVFDNTTTWQAPAPGATTDVSDDVLALAITETANSPAQLHLTLSNQAGQYNNHPSVRADARITVAFGYGTTTLVTHVFILDAYTYQVAPAVNDLEISARNHVKLLDYPQHRFLVYQGKNIAQLATTIAKSAPVPLASLPGTTQFLQTVPCFVISPGETWFQALVRLAAIYGFDFFADQTPQLRIQERQSTDPSTWSYGTEAFSIAYGQSADQANLLRVTGQSSTSPPTPVFRDTIDAANILLTGRERFRNIVDRQLDTAAKCGIRGSLSLHEEQMDGVHGEVLCTINPQHELLDVIQITDPSINLTNKPMRIHAISWIAHPEHGTWEQKLQLSGV